MMDMSYASLARLEQRMSTSTFLVIFNLHSSFHACLLVLHNFSSWNSFLK
jgi:hypothetical protein